MKKIQITSQEELDNTPKKYNEYTEIEISGTIFNYNHKFEKAAVKLINGGTIVHFLGGELEDMTGGEITNFYQGSISNLHNGLIINYYNGDIKFIDNISILNFYYGNIYIFKGGVIKNFYNGVIQNISGGLIKVMKGGTIRNIWNGNIEIMNNGEIFSLHDDGKIKRFIDGSISRFSGCIDLFDNGYIGCVHRGLIKYMKNGIIDCVLHGSIENIFKGIINDVKGGVIKKVCGSVIIKVAGTPKLEKILKPAIVIFENRSPKAFTGNAESISETTTIYTKDDFEQLVDLTDNKLILYKTVEPLTRRDFYSKSIVYEDIVKCPDWDLDPNIQCGRGLHLSFSPHLALSYNNGLLLKCEVEKSDYVIYSEDLSKVRCSKVKVLGECDLDGNLII